MSVSEYEFFPSPKRVRVVLGGEVIADSRAVGLLRGERSPPSYYFPEADLRTAVLEPASRTEAVPGLGVRRYFHVRVGSLVRPDAAWRFERTEPGWERLASHVAFEWDSMDGWFEEELEVFAHPRDPRKRIDIAPSMSLVEVVLEGVTVAHSPRPLFLFETGLPVRYYLPRLDCRIDLLEASDTISYCPYKGEARYYSLRVGGRFELDVAWSYRFPSLEASAVATTLAFYQERVEIYVDGQRV